MIIKGRVIRVLDKNIDTDIIYPGRYLNITDKLLTAEHVFELAYPEIKKNMRPGDIIVAGRNFGCGSSREQAAAAIKYAGFGAVIAESFARIFFRNSINLGLPLIISEQAHIKVKEGDELEIRPIEGRIRNLTASEDIPASPLDEKAAELLKEGGLIARLKKKYG
ncbi:MAG: 3-isopropylmalate dehydratase small subunit [Elusimicrobia bacterium]|nr:3-isopropylmalate dehydratase small subunit [Elusimicrobiota bacterium]